MDLPALTTPRTLFSSVLGPIAIPSTMPASIPLAPFRDAAWHTAYAVALGARLIRLHPDPSSLADDDIIGFQPTPPPSPPDPLDSILNPLPPLFAPAGPPALA